MKYSSLFWNLICLKSSSAEVKQTAHFSYEMQKLGSRKTLKLDRIVPAAYENPIPPYKFIQAIKTEF